MERIIHMGSDSGDIILDCFGGSGTTAAVAHKMGRRWVTIERSQTNVNEFILPRLTKVVQGEDPGGITDQYGWEGGGGFTHYQVCPSMFNNSELGGVHLANWATNQLLAHAVAAQYDFIFEPQPPFHAHKGNYRMAVIDGMVTPQVVEELLDHLTEDEKLIIAATALDPEAKEHLQQKSRGSNILKIPGSILASYNTGLTQIGLFE